MKLNTKMVVLTALTITLLSSGGAFAQGKSGTAGSNRNNTGGGNSQAAQDGNQGAIASELKWRNAAHASAQAFLNASPNSAVGKLAIYKEATEAAEEAYVTAGVNPVGYIARDVSVIEGEIAAVGIAIGELDELSLTYEEDLGVLVASLAALETELELVEVLVVEEEAIQLVGADTLSGEALTALWELLNK